MEPSGLRCELLIAGSFGTGEIKVYINLSLEDLQARRDIFCLMQGYAQWPPASLGKGFYKSVG